MISAVKAEVDFLVISTGTFSSTAIFTNSGSGVKSLQNTTPGISKDKNSLYIFSFFSEGRDSIYVYSTKPITCNLVASKCSKYPAS